jgi:hypothetical protein
MLYYGTAGLIVYLVLNEQKFVVNSLSGVVNETEIVINWCR